MTALLDENQPAAITKYFNMFRILCKVSAQTSPLNAVFDEIVARLRHFADRERRFEDPGTRPVSRNATNQVDQIAHPTQNQVGKTGSTEK